MTTMLTTIQPAPLATRSRAFGSSRSARPAFQAAFRQSVRPAGRTVTVQAAQAPEAQTRAKLKGDAWPKAVLVGSLRLTTICTLQEPTKLVQKIVSAAAAASLVLLPFAGASLADLDTTTEKKGVSATIEGSDITGEDQNAVLDKLKNKILPEAKEMLGKVGSNEGGNYPSSAAKELETVSTEVQGLIKQASEGGDMSNIKSSASGIEQQINALKAIVGFD